MFQSSKDLSKEQTNDLFNKYLLIYSQGNDKRDELEIRFGTNYKNPITKIKFHNVIEKLKSLGFTISKNRHYLNINNEYTDPRTGSKKISNIRTEIYDTHNIKTYCNSNTLNLEKKTLMKF
jgi:hypothetical protein